MSARYGFVAIAAAILIWSGPVNGQSLDRYSTTALKDHPEILRLIQGDHSPRALSADARGIRGRETLTDALRAERLLSKSAQIWLLLQQTDQVWNSDAGDWLNEGRITYMRTEQGDELGYLIESWDAESEAWINELRQTSQLDAQGRVVTSLTGSWDANANGGAGAWIGELRTSYEYNSAGNTVLLTMELWDEASEDFFIWFRLTSTYDGSGELLLQEVSESAFLGDLEPSFRYSYEYDGAGNETAVLSEAWDGVAGAWNPYLQESTGYDDNGEEVEWVSQVWNSGTETWMNSQREVTSYTPDSNSPTQVEVIEQAWDFAGGGGVGAWANTDRTINTYSPNATSPTQFVELTQEWDPAAGGGEGDWVNVERETSNFAGASLFTSYLLEEWNPEANTWNYVEQISTRLNEQGLVSEYLTEVWQGSDWANAFRSLLTYEESGSVASEGEHPVQPFWLEENYPNPFSRATSIRFRLEASEHVTLEVFDVLGRRIATLVDGITPKGTHEVTLDGSALSGGLYVYRLSGETMQAARTMLLLK